MTRTSQPGSNDGGGLDDVRQGLRMATPRDPAKLAAEKQLLRELTRQPPTKYTSTVAPFEATASGFATLAVDPSRGSLLNALTDITLVDTVLEIDEQTELITLFGSLDELAPGQAVLVAYEIEPERDLTLRTRVTAFPTDDDGDTGGPSVSARGEYNINTFEPDRDPGFGDGFGAAVDILQGLWIAIKVLAGFLLLPALILVPLAIAFRRFVSPWLRNRREAKAERAAELAAQRAGYSAKPPPPAPRPTVGAPTAGGSSSTASSTGAPEATSAEGTLPPPKGDDV